MPIMNGQQNMNIMNSNNSNNNDPDRPPPPIFITSADNQQQQQQQQQGNFYLNINDQQQNLQQQQSAPNSPLSTHSSPRLNHPLTVQTQQLNGGGQRSPSSLTPTYQNAINIPLPPSPCPTSPGFLTTASSASDDNNNLYNSPQSRSPIMTPNSYILDPNQQQHQFNQTNFHP